MAELANHSNFKREMATEWKRQVENRKYSIGTMDEDDFEIYWSVLEIRLKHWRLFAGRVSR